MSGIPHDQVHPDTLAAIMDDIASDPFLKEHFAIIQVDVPDTTAEDLDDADEWDDGDHETPFRDLAGYDPVSHQADMDAGRPGQ